MQTELLIYRKAGMARGHLELWSGSASLIFGVLRSMQTEQLIYRKAGMARRHLELRSGSVSLIFGVLRSMQTELLIYRKAGMARREFGDGGANAIAFIFGVLPLT
ncbi:hypothetical protein ACE6ED_00935 [Paenibacillus sp. CN-4]|uniref:hypothetical protein n=1 Tax=Paenibacillus nanchangensis TaxID=3348343 RepID=UPI0039799216